MSEPSASRLLTIFVIHPSQFLTDFRGHGDGLTAFGFISQLARRGHRLHVAVEAADLRDPLPPNVTLHPITLHTSWGPLRRIEYMLKVRALFNRLRKHERFDVAHQFNPVYSGLSLALLGSGIPIVLGTYIPEWPNGAARALRSFAKALVAAPQQAAAAALLLTTPAARPRLPLARMLGRKIHYLGNGIDIDRFRPGDEPAPDDQTILFLAQLARKKGVFTLLDAFAQVALRFPAAQLWIAGDGVDGVAVRRQAQTMEAADRVRFFGALEHGATSRFYRESAVYCMPSFGEPYGMTALEAMACAKPVIATNTGGPRYLVPEAGGRHVPPGDSAALAGALEEILASEPLRAEMGRYNRAYIEREFAWDRVIERLETIYGAVIAK